MEWKIKKGTPWAYGVWIGEKQINLVFEAAQRKKVKDRRQTEDVLKESENRLRVYRLVRWDIGGYPAETGVEIRRCLCGFTGWTKP